MSEDPIIAFPARTVRKINASRVLGLLCFFAFVGWGFLQVYFQFSSNSGLWANALPEPLNTNLGYVIYWLRILPIFVAFGFSFFFSWAGEGWGAAYAAIGIEHWGVVLMTDRSLVVQGLAFVAGL